MRRKADLSHPGGPPIPGPGGGTPTGPSGGSTPPEGRPRRRAPAGAARDQISFAMATAVSLMRFEKPHSLSYQDMTRTSVPSMTLVWSMWKIDECGS